MSTKIPYYDNISESFKNINLQSSSPDFELIHFEDIPDRNMNERKPFRMNAFVVGLFTGGNAVLTINSKDHHLSKGTLYFSTPWHIRKYTNIHDWKGFILFFTPQYLFRYHPADTMMREFPFFQSDNGVVILSPEKENQLEVLFNTMYGVFKCSQANRFQILFHYINILLLECKSVQVSEPLRPNYGPENITNLFLEEVNNHFTRLTKGTANESLTLTKIARQLHLHPNYLSTLVKSQSGKTVAHLIRERIVLEAKALLRNTSMTVSEISYHLQFKDTSNFAKFFKNNTGHSPSAFRQTDMND